MDVLYTWMLDKGLDPSLLPYGAAALALVLLLIIHYYLRADRRKIDPADTAAEPQDSIEAAPPVTPAEPEIPEAETRQATTAAAAEQTVTEEATAGCGAAGGCGR